MELKEIEAQRSQDYEQLKSLAQDLHICKSVSYWKLFELNLDWVLTVRPEELIGACGLARRLWGS